MIKTKFYYKNCLVRTSANPYNYALIIECDDGCIRVFKCSATYQGCEKELNRVSKLYDSLTSAGISYDEWRAREKEKCDFYEKYNRFPEANEFDNKVKKVMREKKIWSDQYADRRKLKIVKLEAR